ncbi:class I SAM-dependent methyltransferase [Thalassoglobus sp.]|uniref:class I SAM-dependent methyltransferase n=1 Tax=Thalassoglobus sp. TaxID=2795869 RepID=UPI003AA7CF8F
MNSIADSDAYFNPERMLVQHQAALTLLQGMLADPNSSTLDWLDLACGRGQVISHLKDNISDNHRKKIRYCGYDIDNNHSRNAAQVAESLELGDARFDIGEISRFSDVLPNELSFDFITLTNTVHEIIPVRLSGILFDCINRLSPNGSLFIYDMDKLPSPELGAVLWSTVEIKSVIATLCAQLGASEYEPAIGQWQHSSCNGWNVQIKRSHLSIPEEIADKREAAVMATAERIQALLTSKLQQTRGALESLTKFGAGTGNEASDKESYLYSYWALTRAQEAK